MQRMFVDRIKSKDEKGKQILFIRINNVKKEKWKHLLTNVSG